MIALVIVLGLIGIGALAYWRLWWAVIVIPVIAPAYVVRFEILSIPTTFLEVALYIVAVIWFIRLLQRKVRLKSVPRSWLILTALWLIIGLTSVYYSTDQTEALGIWKAYFFDAAIFFVLLVTTIRKKYQLARLMWLLGATVLIVSLIAIWQSLELIPSSEPWISQTPPRVSSIFEYPNALGLFIAPLVALFLPRIVTNIRQAFARQNRLALGVVVFGTLATALAVSQGALLGIAAALIVVSAFSQQKIYLYLAMGVAIVLVMVIPVTREAVIDLVTFQDTSGDVRLRLWQGTANMLIDNPVAGAGLTDFPQLYDEYRDAAHVELSLYPHNIILNTWVTVGLAGVLLFITILIKVYRSAMNGLRRTVESYDRSLMIGLVAAMTALVVHGLVDVPYFKNDLAILFWLIVGMTVVGHQLIQTPDA